MHSRSVGIEDPDDFGFDFMLPVVVHEQSFCATLSFVITASDPYGVYIAPVVFSLRVGLWVLINLARRRLQNFCTGSFCEAQHINRAMYACFRGLNGVTLVVNR